MLRYPKNPNPKKETLKSSLETLSQSLKTSVNPTRTEEEEQPKIVLEEIANKLERDFGADIFDKLTHTENKNKKATRLFDTSRKTSEQYNANYQGKPTVYDYKDQVCYYPISAYQKANGTDWRKSVIELGKYYDLIPKDYDKTPKAKWGYTPKKVITAKEQSNGLWLLTNPILKPLDDLYLKYWQKYGVGLELLEMAKIKVLQHFDLVNTETGETDTKNPQFAFSYDLGNGVYKAYQPNDKNHKWSWIFANPESKKQTEVVYWIDEIPIKCDKIFIVEGLKDCLVLNANFNQYDYYAVGLDSAGQSISTNTMAILKDACNELVFCLDNDNTGIKENIAKALDFKCSFLPYYTPQDKAKDFADLVLFDNHQNILDWLQNGNRQFSKQSTANTSKNTTAHSPSLTEQATKKEQVQANNILETDFENPKLLDEVVEILKGKDATELELLKRQLTKEKAINIAESYLSKSYSIRNNIIANRFEYCKILKDDFRELNADEINREFLKKNIKFSLGAIKSLLKSDFVPEYNPFLAYFKDLPEWKETDTDYITELAKYITTSDNERFLYHFKKFLVRAVACAIDDKVINKQCLVLVSPQQNNGKSTFTRFLAPPKLAEYITENIGTDKDSLIALCQNFWINLDELSTLNKTEINALKSVFSKDVVKVRKPYDANPTTAPRVASFIGSTNRDEFLSDETGSVRWLCFDVLNIDFAYSKLDIDLVYSQAYSLYKNGFEYQMTKQDVEANEEANKKYKVVTIEKEILMQTFRPVSNEEYEAKKHLIQFEAMAMNEILEVIQGEKKTMLKPYNLTQALKDLGYVRKSVRKGEGNPYKAYLVERISNLSAKTEENEKKL